ncbi:Coatomer subunit alpha [Plasmodiophora brassicae]
MLTKFETKSSRVKGLAFHPKRPWILCSLHSGAIQLWDYRMETMIDKFEEHDGPVRGVDFHLTQPLFVSGGDDSKIRVWNYQMRRCLFHLTGHLDYIRTVKFHHEYPWILSASDDQTIRIWNWQSRSCVSVLTGHNHYVMCAQFHPSEDLILSASLDQTVRVWDIAGLRKKTVFSATGSAPSREFQDRRAGSGTNQDLFSTNDFVVKYVLEGHQRGVNWASFHPKLPLIVSGADDREVKLWRMSDVKAWEVDTMRGHINNVSCVIFHPRQEVIISNSEDKSIRVWDMSRQSPPQSLRRETDRYWILAAHPTLNILAAGHDSGMFMFKLQRERPPFDTHRSLCYYYFNRQVRLHDFQSGSESVVCGTRRQTSASSLSAKDATRFLRYNSMNNAEINILLLSDADGGTYELYTIAQDALGQDIQPQRGLGNAACFVSRNRFAVLSQGSRLVLKNFANEPKRTVDLPISNVVNLFPAGVGRVLLVCSDKVLLFDIEARKVLGEVSVQARCPVKTIVWSRDRKYCAIVSKFVIYICGGADLADIATLTENARIKGGAWDTDGVFIYTTSNHIKYCLSTGDSGIIRTLDVPVYITGVRGPGGSTVDCLDRDGQACSFTVDNTEAVFKSALLARRYDDVRRIIQSNKLVGQSIIGYLQDKGFPEVALFFVKDERTKFALAVQCGNIDIALECAQTLQTTDCWAQLAQAALRQGNLQVVELAYQKSRQYDKLSLLYLVTGDTAKLSKMLHIAQMREDAQSRFHHSLMLGNVEERVGVLEQTGNSALAYIVAKSHSLSDRADELHAKLEGAEIADVPGASLLLPPMPIALGSNWPRVHVARGYFDGQAGADGQYEIVEHPEEADSPTAAGPVDVDVSGWGGAEGEVGEDDLMLDVPAMEPGGWGDDLQLDSLPEVPISTSSAQHVDYFVMPTVGHGFARRWLDSAALPCDFIAAGEVQLARKALERMIGVVDYRPLQEHATTISESCRISVPGLPGTSSWSLGLGDSHPVHALNMAACQRRMTEGYRLFMDTSSLEDAARAFRSALAVIPLLEARTRAQAKEAQDAALVCKEYITAARLGIAKNDPAADDNRKCELAALLTCCRLQPVHTFLALYSAVGQAMKLRNFHLAGHCARSFLDLSRSHRLPRSLEAAVDKLKQVARHCDQNDTDASPLSFDPSLPVKIDTAGLRALSGDNVIRCPFCQSEYSPSQKAGSVCVTCQIAGVGNNAQGLFANV